MAAPYFTKLYALNSFDATYDARFDVLFCELTQVTFTVGTNTGTLEVPTNLDVIYAVLPGNGEVAVVADDYYVVATDGVISSGKITVVIHSTSIPNGDYVTNLIVVGKKVATDI